MIQSSFCSIAFQKAKWAKDLVVEQPLPTILPVLAAAGFDGVEIWQPHVEGMSPAELDALAGQLRELGLAVPMLSPYFDFTTSDDAASESLAKARRVLEQARRLGACAIRVFTGKTGSAEASDQQWQRAAAALRELADASAADGIAWALELHGRNLTDTRDGARRILEMIDRPNTGLVAHAPEQLDALDLPGLRVLHIHARNSKAGQAAPLSAGETDYAAIIQRLRQHGYRGAVSVEWMGPDAAGVAQADGPFLRGLLHGQGRPPAEGAPVSRAR